MTAAKQTSEVLRLASALLSIPSVCPDAGESQSLISGRLGRLGFVTERIDAGGAKHLWAERTGSGPLFVFSGHTDVVPPGQEKDWVSPPFNPSIREGRLFGRGACDMKGALAAMMVATERFLSRRNGVSNISLGFLIVGDEEGDSTGTPAVLDLLRDRGVSISDCIVGEPTSVKDLGDTVKIGRRGSVRGEIIFHGVQGHVGYPHRATNAIHAALSSLSELVHHEWDKGAPHFEPTSFQVTRAEGGVAENVIPGEFRVEFDWRNSPDVDVHRLDTITREIVSKSVSSMAGAGFDLALRVSAEPFLTAAGSLTRAVSAAIKEITDHTAEFSTSGGTSDARFFPKYGARVIELGLVNESIHKVNESVLLEDLERLALIYERCLDNYAAGCARNG